MTTELYLEIREYLREIISGTEWEGHLFAVGGCCRDELMELPIKDVDMAVNLPAGGVRFAEWLRDRRLTLHEPVTFPNYGTAMLRLRAFPDDEIELVQTRKEKYTDRNRRNPETVFGTLEDDCMRRDLTINSLYYDVTRREFVDITGKGIEDIQNHIIRTPSDPDFTYDDDPLRILRCIRFASRFGWDIEKETFEGMKRNVARLSIITAERIRTELDKMLLCDHPDMALEMMHATGALRMVLPELSEVAASSHITLWRQTLRALTILPDNLSLRLATLLLITSDSPETAERIAKNILKRLKYSNDIIDSVSFLIRNSAILGNNGDNPEIPDDRKLRMMQYECRTRERFDSLLTLIDAHHIVKDTGRIVPEIMRRTDRMEQEQSTMFGYRLPVSGQDVMRIKSIPPGPEIKVCLDNLMSQAFDNPLRTKEEFEALLSESE